MNEKPMSYWIEQFIKILPTITKEESDMLAEILKWESEKKAGFLLAKKIFEEKKD